ncbi:MAG: prepilin-type N-terminal cleavage/methylation domain-containing protein [Patescibacteria group bacterium]|nr:prepilin-type N-terminal cleavage/methylation domain-containing protein [Patescibacteria group bacterium]
MNFEFNKKGFTILEAIVAVAIFALLAIAIISLYLFSDYSKNVVWEQLSTQNEGRKTAQDFGNELRTAKISGVGAYPLESAASQQIIFYSDIDADGLAERVRYFKDATNFKKGVIEPSGSPISYNPANEAVTIIAHDVANGSDPVFYYYNENFSGSEEPLAQPINVTQVRVVKISLILEEDPNMSPVPFRIEAKTMIRNLKGN